MSSDVAVQPAGRSARWLAHAAALTTALIWSLSFVMIKVGGKELDPVPLYLLRYYVGAASVLAYWAFRRPSLGELDLRGWVVVLSLAVLTGPVYQILQNFGARGTSSGLLAMLIATAPLHTSWVAALVLRERFQAKSFLAVVLGMIGVCVPIIVGSKDFTIAGLVYPAAVALAAVVAAFTSVVARRIRHRLDPWAMTALVCVLACLASVPLIGHREIEQTRNLSFGGWLAVIYLGVPGLSIALVMWYFALRHLPALTVMFYLFVMMVVATVWGRLILGEPIHPVNALAILLVSAGLVINTRR